MPLTEPRFSNRLTILWFASVLALGVWSRSDLQHRRAERCSLDGVALSPTARVDLVRGAEELARFCCTKCAGRWPEVPDGGWWRVRDETTGASLAASEAIFVKSRLVTSRARQDYVHTFAHLRDALAHAEHFGGRVIPCPLPAVETRAAESVDAPPIELRTSLDPGQR